MRALYLTILCSSSLIIQSSGQSLAPVGARWYIMAAHDYDWQISFTPYFMLEAIGDTVIDGRDVRMIRTFPGSVYAPPWTGYFSEEEEKVFFHEEGEFKLLYDFGVNAGDTLEFHIPQNRYGWDLNDQCLDTINEFKALVVSTDFFDQGNISLRRIFTVPLLSPDEVPCRELDVVTERIGTKHGLFGFGGIIHAGIVSESVICYSDEDLQIVSGGMACDFVNGKPFAPFHAAWHYEDASSDCSIRTYFRLESVTYLTEIYYGYKKVWVFEGAGSEPVAEAILRHDFDQVRFREDGVYKLLYDFSLEGGDTMTFSVPRNRHHFDIACKDSVELEETYQVVVDSVTIVEVDGLSLRALHTSPIGDQCIDLGVITEKFGSSNGLFGTLCDGCGTGCPGHFRCYEDNDLSFMASVEACDFTTSLRKTPDVPDMIVYPVPASDHLRLSGIVPGDIVRLDIIDMLGRSYQVPVGLSIDLSLFTAGQYILSVRQRDGHQSFRRFVKM